MTKNEARRAKSVFKIFTSETYRAIAMALDPIRSKTVTQVYVDARKPQSEASRILNEMKRAGLASSQRDGKFIRYRLNKAAYDKLEKTVAQFTDKVNAMI